MELARQTPREEVMITRRFFQLATGALLAAATFATTAAQAQYPERPSP
jgi:hypothetical protein